MNSIGTNVIIIIEPINLAGVHKLTKNVFFVIESIGPNLILILVGFFITLI